MRTIFQQETQWKVSPAHANYFAKGWRHPDRVMREHDLVYILEGEWEIYVEDQPFFVKRDQVILLPAGLHHYGLKPCADGTRTMYIHACEKQGKAEEGEAVPLQTVTDCANAPNIRRDFERIVTEFASVHSYRESRLSALFQLLLTDLFAVQQGENDALRDELVKQAVSIMRNDPGAFHHLEQLSSLLHVSPRTVVNRFEKTLHTTPHQYELEMKLNAAAEFLLEFPDAKLHEVAANFGFYDEFHLSRTFSRRFFTPPSAYRKQGGR